MSRDFPHASVAPGARLAPDVEVGHFAVVEDGATIGAGTIIGHGAIIERGCVVGDRCAIGHGAVLGAGTTVGVGSTIQPGALIGRRPRGNALLTHPIGAGHGPARLAAGCQIGANAVIYAGVLLAEDVLVGDLASIREGSTVGAGTIVGRGAMIEYDCRIGPRVKIQTGCYVTGETVIAAGAFLGPSVTMANDKQMDRVAGGTTVGPRIGRGVRIGSNATLLPAVRLGDDCAVGAGAVVTHDVPAGTIVTGVPARHLKDVPPEYRLPASGEGA